MATDVKKRLKGVPCFYHSGYIKCMTMVLFKKTKTKNTSSMTLINKKSNCLLKKKTTQTQDQHDS